MAISDYLRDLRAIIGTQLVLVPTVSALIFDEEGRLLVLHSAERDIWMLPGGAVDPDERPEDAVVREVFEEIGLTARVDSLHSVHGGPEFRVTYSNGDQCAYVMTCYRCTVTGGTIQPDGEEVAGFRWVDREEALSLPSPPWTSVVFPAAFGI